MIELNGRGRWPAWTDHTPRSKQLAWCDGVSTTLAAETSKRGYYRRHEDSVITVVHFFPLRIFKENISKSKWLVAKIAPRTATNESIYK